MEGAHCQEAEQVLNFFQVDPRHGLDDRDVQQAQARYGRNELAVEEGTPLWKLVLKQFDDLLVKILLAAAAIDLIIGLSDGESFLSSMVEPSVIILILVANATVGVVTERNAEHAIGELRAYEAGSAKVVRGGLLQSVAAADVVPGDIVEVAVGDQVPADARLVALHSSVLRVDQSILTGESQSVDKTPFVVHNPSAVLQDKTNLLFSGTLVTSGRATAVVVATGSSTAIGRIRDAMSAASGNGGDAEQMTPLKRKLNEFGELLSKVIAVICILVWLVNFNRFTDPALGGWWHGAIYYFKIAVALAVAAIPEGLPAVVTTCLALGTRKMAQLNAIVRSLPSVETLGCTTVICSDKTGTLTTNQMSVVGFAALAGALGGTQEYSVAGTTYNIGEGDVVTNAGGAVLREPGEQVPVLRAAALVSALCNDATLSYQPNSGSYSRIGESTELALRVFVEKVGPPNGTLPDGVAWPSREPVCNSYWQQRYQREAVLEFTRDRKMMSVLASGDGQRLLLTKGAPEAVLAACTHALTAGGSGGGGDIEAPVGLTNSLRAALLERMRAYGSSRALRVLALAYKVLPGAATPLLLGRGGGSSGQPSSAVVSEADEAGLTFVGLVAMHDPPRRECAGALETCAAAGIRVVVVTGDNLATAEAVCRQIGALGLDHGAQAGPVALTGAEFDSLAPVAQAEAANSLVVFARVEPLHKLRLVELLRAQGHVVAMTGDGVNDAPALVRADIGVAMGSGTGVARAAADMVLADDNFATIVAAVAEGRAIYANTKQFIRYMISSNIGEVVAIFLAALLGCPEVLTPVQLLWVNLVTDGLPATALGFNKPDRDLMARPPRRISEPIVNGWLFFRYIVVGAYVGLVTVVGFLWWYLHYSGGPRLSWHALTSFQKCSEEAAKAAGYSCSVFSDAHPKTISMTVLVIVEMFNALNNLSEDASLLLLPPWANPWLLGAIAVSVLLHLLIMYIPWLALVFGITHLSWAEWRMVLLLSAPVVLLDEGLKAVSRARGLLRRVGARRRRGGGNASAGSGMQLLQLPPLAGIQVTSPLVTEGYKSN